MSKKAWIIIIIIIVGLFGYLLWSGKSDNNKSASNSSSSATKADPTKIKSDDHVTGSKAHKYVVIEYLDMACPACGEFYPTMKSLASQYGDEVTFVTRYFPLTSLHPNAMVSARAAEAAGKQDKFFQMEDKLFTNQDSWTSASAGAAQKTFEGYAKDLGLDMTKYRTDYSSDSTLDRINEDRDLATKLNLTGTPSIFLNGKQVKMTNQDDLGNAIKAAIKNKQYDSHYKK